MLVFRPSSATGSFPFAQAIGCPLALEWIWAICMYVDRSSRARLATDTFRCPCRLASSLISTLFVITPSLQAGAWYYRYSVRIVFPISSVQGRVGKYTRPGFSPLPLSQVQSLLSPTTGYDTPVHRLWHKKDKDEVHTYIYIHGPPSLFGNRRCVLSWACGSGRKEADRDRRSSGGGSRLQITWLIGHVAISKGVVEKGHGLSSKKERKDCVMRGPRTKIPDHRSAHALEPSRLNETLSHHTRPVLLTYLATYLPPHLLLHILLNR